LAATVAASVTNNEDEAEAVVVVVVVAALHASLGTLLLLLLQQLLQLLLLKTMLVFLSLSPFLFLSLCVCALQQLVAVPQTNNCSKFKLPVAWRLISYPLSPATAP